MKKNITINLFGSLYAIDEDAYELLEKYQNSIRTYFSKQEGGEEIADDIEHRVAELFAELRSKGIEAITIEHVEDIIGRIGNPEQMEEATGEDIEGNPESSNNSNAQPINKKLFRDPSDQMLGGVMSGLSHYFGGEPLAWRLLLIVLSIATSFIFLLIYIAAWILIPCAKTPQDVLRMKGIEITPENIAQVVMNNDTTLHRVGLNKGLEILMTLLKILLYALYGVFLIWFICGLIACVVYIVLAIFGEIATGKWYNYVFPIQELAGMTGINTTNSLISFWMLVASCFVCCAIPIYCAVHYVLSYRNTLKPMSLTQRVVCLISWVLSVVLIIASVFIFTFSLYNRDKLVDSTIAEQISQSINSNDQNDLGNKYYDHFWNTYIYNCCENSENEGEKKDCPVLGVEFKNKSFTYQTKKMVPNIKAGMYRLKVKALCDNTQCYAYISFDGQKFIHNITKGRPGIPSLNAVSSADSTSSGIKDVDMNQLKTEPLLALADCVVDSVLIPKDTEVEYGVETLSCSTEIDMEGRYLAYAKKMVFERIGDLPDANSNKAKPQKKR